MKISSLLILLFCSTALSAAEKITFDRPLKPGQHFECRIQTDQSARYSFRLPGNPDPVIKLETFRAEFRGYVSILKVNRAGNPTSMKIRADRLSGLLDGRSISLNLPANAEITADLSAIPARFHYNGRELSRNETKIFRLLFHPALENRLSDLTGTTRELPAPGGSWRPELSGFQKTLADRKIELKPAAMKAGITYYGKDAQGKRRCQKFGMLIETAGLPDYDFRFQAYFWLAPQGPPVKLVRNVTEVVRRVLRSSQAFAAGTQVELISEDHTEQWMLPVSALPAPAKKKSPASGEWDSLLR